MQRILFSAGWYAAGLVTVPVLMWGVEAASARSAGHQLNGQLTKGVHSACRSGLATCSSAMDLTGCGAHSATQEAAVTEIDLATDVFQRSSDVATVAPQFDEMVQADPNRGAPNVEVEVKEFAPDTAVIPRSSTELGEPKPVAVAGPRPDVSEVVLPVTPEMLAPPPSDHPNPIGAPPDDQKTKLAELRETLKTVVEEKAAMLSASALEAEIAMHRRHLSDLQALQELLKLQQSLKELSDKFPNSDAGRRAAEMLQLLNQSQRDQPLRRRLQPTPDVFDQPTNREPFLPQSPVRQKQT